MATLALSLNNNVFEFHAIESSSTTKLSTIAIEGHRDDVKSLTLSSDNTLLMSTSHNAFIDLRSCTCVGVVEAHGGGVQSIALIPDGTCFLTCSVDHDVKFN